MKYTFETAIVWLKRGHKIARSSWFEDEYLSIVAGVILYHWMDARGDKRKGILELTSADVLAEDWMVVDGKEI